MAAEVLGPAHRRMNKEWYDAVCKKAVQEKYGMKKSIGIETEYIKKHTGTLRDEGNVTTNYEDDQVRKVE